MDFEQMRELVEESVRDVDLRPEDIPSIDLYLDQIISLVDEKRNEGSDRFSDRVLTKTMINNYSKDGLISPVKGKKYTKEQILQMLLVYSLKSTLSIAEIKRILQCVYTMPGYDGAVLEDAYRDFLEIKEFERGEAWPLIRLFIRRSQLDVTDDGDFITLLLGLASMSAYLKNVVRTLSEARYSDAQKKRAGKKQQRKEAKKQAAKGEEETKKSRKEKSPDAGKPKKSPKAEGAEAPENGTGAARASDEPADAPKEEQ